MSVDYPSHWEDMSNYVVHFTKGAGKLTDASVNSKAYRSHLSILHSCTLKPAAPFGVGRSNAPDKGAQMAVCFSEIPPGQWSRLSQRRKSAYGIGFSKNYILGRGGGPIWYARKGSPHLAALKKLMRAGKGKPEHPVWSITPMIDAPGSYGFSSYEYEWEREWRHIGGMRFEPEDVAFLFIPEGLHGIARHFFEDAYHHHTGPAYFCPFIDPFWSKDRVEEELAKAVK
ncbi:hypothetical protein [Ralstonia pseudosolanacearum]|uniref:hypothetical protein n=1 Tax=Ralstonia pseudosolanacearum TaxID=1310165 RepID=UPI0039C6251A